MKRDLSEKAEKTIREGLKEGLSPPEIAKAAGVAVTTVYRRRRALRKNDGKQAIKTVSEGYHKSHPKEVTLQRAKKVAMETDNPDELYREVTTEMKELLSSFEKRLHKAEGEIDSLEEAVAENYEDLKEEFSDRETTEDAAEDTPHDEINRGDVLDLGEVETEDKHTSEDLIKLLLAAGGLYMGMRLLPKTADVNVKNEGW